MRTIKDIIDAERWVDGCEITTEEANYALDRIEAALKNEIKQIERAAELEEQMPKVKPTVKPTGVVHREYHAAVVERLEQRIAELEAELKETVAELDAALADNKAANMRVAELEADKKWLHDFIKS